MFGKSHSEDSKRAPLALPYEGAKISITNGYPVYIYDSNTFELLSIEPSRCAAARFCKIDESTVRKYLISGKPYGNYLFRSSETPYYFSPPTFFYYRFIYRLNN
jgi:hypothetical protein